MKDSLEWEDRIELIWNRAHIPEYANDAKTVIKSFIKEQVAKAKEEERARIRGVVEKMRKEVPRGWKDKELKWGTIPAPVMALVEYNYALTDILKEIEK